MIDDDPLSDIAAPVCDTCGTVIGYGEVICRTCEKGAQAVRNNFEVVERDVS